MEAGIATASNHWSRLIVDLRRRLLCPPPKVVSKKIKKMKKPTAQTGPRPGLCAAAARKARSGCAVVGVASLERKQGGREE
jgi:hypothetical protein